MKSSMGEGVTKGQDIFSAKKKAPHQTVGGFILLYYYEVCYGLATNGTCGLLIA